ncbi:DUF916 and DUF3324 domain-containing protein [Enterococcus sp. LJL99]
MKIKQSLLALGVFFLGALFFYSDGKVAFAEEMSFSVEAKIPNNQRDKDKTYFDLTVKPGEVQDLEVALRNNTNKAVTVLVNANTAITNKNGVIDYSEVDPKLDPSLKYPFSKLAETENEVELAANESKMIQVKVTVPNNPFDGIILGGLHFKQKDSDDKKSTETGVQIENKFAYVIGVRLSENDTEIKPDLKLFDVKPGQRNYRNVVLANLQNPTARILSKMSIDAKIYPSGSNEVLYQQKQSDLSMAPNSNFDYAVPLNNKAFKAGKYRLTMHVESSGEKWDFEKEFEIKADEAEKFNKEAVELEEESNNNLIYFILGGVILLLIIIALVVWIIVQKKKHQAELERQQKQKQLKRNKKKKTSTKKEK